MVQYDKVEVHDLRIASRNNASKPSISFGDGDTGFYERTPNNLAIAINGLQKFRFTEDQFDPLSDSSWKLLRADPSSTSPNILPKGDDANTGIGHAAADALSLIAGGAEIVRLTTAGLILKTVDVPANASDTGVAGQIAYDANYIYVCTATNTWKRVGISSW